MEIQHTGILIKVDATRVSAVCDECRNSHRRCDRKKPVCARCKQLKIPCTRNIARTDYKTSCLLQSGWALRAMHTLPLTWAQAIESRSRSACRKYYMRRYLLPLAMLLPEPSKAKEFERLVSRASRLLPAPTPTTILQACPALLAHEACRKATQNFFCNFNPFYPLFSEESFSSRPRSATLRKIVILVGLESLPRSATLLEAARQNSIAAEELEKLPLSLDTFQCHLLVLFGLPKPGFRKDRIQRVWYTWRLLSLLGLHVPSACHERKLAAEMFMYGYHHMSIGQAMAICQYNWFATSGDHLAPRFLDRRLGDFSNASDLVHFVASTTTYHSFTTVAAAHRACTRARIERTPGSRFQAALRKYVRQLDENFAWGWKNLACLTIPSQHSQLLFKSRLTLALRYHNDSLDLMRLGLYIPSDPNAPVTQTHHVDPLNKFSQMGLRLAMRNIRLVATIDPCCFVNDYIRTLVPSLAFLLLHLKPIYTNYGQAGPLAKSIAEARACLSSALAAPALEENASCYIQLIDGIVQRNRLPVAWTPL